MRNAANVATKTVQSVVVGGIGTVIGMGVMITGLALDHSVREFAEHNKSDSPVMRALNNIGESAARALILGSTLCTVCTTSAACGETIEKIWSK